MPFALRNTVHCLICRSCGMIFWSNCFRFDWTMFVLIIVLIEWFSLWGTTFVWFNAKFWYKDFCLVRFYLTNPYSAGLFVYIFIYHWSWLENDTWICWMIARLYARLAILEQTILFLFFLHLFILLDCVCVHSNTNLWPKTSCFACVTQYICAIKFR